MITPKRKLTLTYHQYLHWYSRRSRITTRGNVHPTFVKRLPTEYKVEVRPWTAVRPTLYEPFYDVDLRSYQSEDSYDDLDVPAYPNGYSRYSGTRKPQYLRFKSATYKFYICFPKRWSCTRILYQRENY